MRLRNQSRMFVRIQPNVGSLPLLRTYFTTFCNYLDIHAKRMDTRPIPTTGTARLAPTSVCWRFTPTAADVDFFMET